MVKAQFFAQVIDDLANRRTSQVGFAPATATVIRTNPSAGFVDVRLASNEIISRVPVIGQADVGDSITVKHEGGRYIASGARTGNSVEGKTLIIGGGSGTAAPTGLTGVYGSGNLINIDTVTSPGTTLIAVDPLKLGISGGQLSKTGAGSLALQVGANNTAVFFAASGTATLGAGSVSAISINNVATSDHTHAVVSASIPQGSTLVSMDVGGRIGVGGLGIGQAGVVGYSLYSFLTSPSFHRGPMRIGGDVGGAMLYVESPVLAHLRMAHSAAAFSEITTSSTGSMTLFATGPDPSQAHLYFVTAGGLSVGGGQPLARLHVFNTGPWSHLRLAYAGDQYADVNVTSTGNTTLLTYGTEGHLQFAPAGNTSIGRATLPTDAAFEVQSSTQAQQRLSYIDGVYMDSIVDSGGNATMRTSGSSITWDIQPTGGIAGTKEFRPANSYDTRLGNPFKKWSELHVAELYIETLVQFNTSTTVNGRLLITNSSILVNPLAATATGVDNVVLKHNTFAVGDAARMEGGGRVEFMTCIAGPTGAGPYTYTFARNVDGTGANDWEAGDTIVNTGTAGVGFLDEYAWWSVKGAPIEFIFARWSTNWSANQNQTPAFKVFGDNNFPQPGDAQYYGMGGGMWNRISHNLVVANNTGFTGVLEYWNGSAWVNVVSATTVSFDAITGAQSALSVGALPAAPAMVVHDWVITSQTGWAKTVINGINAYWIRWRVTANTTGLATNGIRHVIRGTAQYGPTIAGYVRNSGVFNDYTSRFAVGQLQGHYDYGRSAFGMAAGTPTQTWIAADTLNGFRIMNNIARIGQWDTAGNLRLYGTSGAAKIGLNADGSGFVAGGNASWDAAGNTTIIASLNITGGTVPIGENLAYNSSLEIDVDNDGIPDGWQVYNNNPGNASGTAPQVPMPTGGIDGGKFYQLNVAVGNTGTKGLTANTGTIKRGFKALQTYVISFWAKATGGLATAGIPMGLAWNIAPSSTVTISNPVLSSSWQRYAFKITWGASVDPNLFISVAVTGAAWTGSIGLDAIQVEEGPTLTFWKVSPSELLPGSVSANMINVGQLNAISADMGILYAGDVRLGNQTAANFNEGTFTGVRLYKSGSLYRLEASSAGTKAIIVDESGVLISAPPTTGSPDTRTTAMSLDFGSKSAPNASIFYGVTGSPIAQKLNIVSIANRGISIRSQNANTSPTITAGIYLNWQTGTFGGGPSEIYFDASSARASSNLYVGNVFTSEYVARMRDLNGFLVPAAIGSFAEDYTPTLAKFQANSATYANIILTGVDTTSIAFHDSGARVDAIVAQAGVITIGQDAGFGAARTQFGGSIGDAWTGIGLNDANWQNIGGIYPPLSYKKVGDIVYIRGSIRRINSTYTATNVITTAPFAPAFRVPKTVAGNTGSAAKVMRLDIDQGGNLFLQDDNIGVNGFVSVDLWYSID